MQGKIALEEHFVPSGQERLITNPGWPEPAWRATLDKLIDIDGERLEQMDRYGIEHAVLSLGSDGIQAEVDGAAAVRLAAETNDALATVVSSNPARFSGFAALALQDPAAATAELERSVTELGMKGALVNGFSHSGDVDTALYYDAPEYWPLFERAEGLGVPLYLHPRNPLTHQRVMYEGRPELLGPTWAFGVETGTHALRLITSGLFDRFPNLTVILGHLGEMLPFAINRLEARMRRIPEMRLKRSPTRCLAENFYLTTSGNYHTQSLVGILLQLGADRVMFSADYPFEDMVDAADWFDSVPISEADRRKIGRDNAVSLLGL